MRQLVRRKLTQLEIAKLSPGKRKAYFIGRQHAKEAPKFTSVWRSRRKASGSKSVRARSRSRGKLFRTKSTWRRRRFVSKAESALGKWFRKLARVDRLNYRFKNVALKELVFRGVGSRFLQFFSYFFNIKLQDTFSKKREPSFEISHFFPRIYGCITNVRNRDRLLHKICAFRKYLAQLYSARRVAILKPSRGQRTWSNAWSASQTNLFLSVLGRFANRLHHRRRSVKKKTLKQSQRLLATYEKGKIKKKQDRKKWNKFKSISARRNVEKRKKKTPWQ